MTATKGRNDSPTDDARTVLPGQPVTYHPFAPTPEIPSKIIGTIGQREPEPELPSPGFYWVRLVGADRWEPVEVFERKDGRRFIVVLGDEGNGAVDKWGPKMEAPR